MKGKKPGPTFDKDWQQSRGSRKRLEQISQHFLSEIQPLTSKLSKTVFLPVFVENKSHTQVLQYITKALSTKCDCVLLTLDQPLQKPENNTNAESATDMLERLRTMVSEQSRKATIGLVALSSQHGELIKQLRKVIIPVDTTLDGVRNAYLSIKQLHQIASPEFSIVMLNTDSPSGSQVYFEKLAAGALRFLGLHILYNGYIPDHTNLKSADDQSYRQEIMAVLASRVIQNHRLLPDCSDADLTEHMAFTSVQT